MKPGAVIVKSYAPNGICPKLNDRCAAVEKRTRKVRGHPSGADGQLDVHDGVEAIGD